MMLPIRAVIALMAPLAVARPPESPVLPPAHIILIRHAEKPADAKNPHLSPAGVQRAEQLVSFITSDPSITGLGVPVAIFATKTTRDDDGQRTQETVAPLAKTLKLPVETPYLGKDYAALAKSILKNPAYSGKTVIICWVHESIPQLAAALGVSPRPSKWKSDDFGLVYIISYPNGKGRLATSRYGAK